MTNQSLFDFGDEPEVIIPVKQEPKPEPIKLPAPIIEKTKSVSVLGKTYEVSIE